MAMLNPYWPWLRTAGAEIFPYGAGPRPAPNYWLEGQQFGGAMPFDLQSIVAQMRQPPFRPRLPGVPEQQRPEPVQAFQAAFPQPVGPVPQPAAGMLPAAFQAGPEEAQPQADRFNPLNMALLASGLGILSRSGPSLQPTSAGEAIGAGGLQGLQTYAQLRQQEKEDEFRGQELGLRREESAGLKAWREAQLAEEQAKAQERAQTAAWFAEYDAASPDRRKQMLEERVVRTSPQSLLEKQEKGQIIDLGDRMIVVDPNKIGAVFTKGLNPKDAAKGPDTLNQKEISEIESKLRDDFWQQVGKEFTIARDAIDRVKASAINPSAAGDLALLYNYMKLLDPIGVVREQDFALAASTGAFGERIKALVAKAVSGERLTEELRNDFLNRSDSLFERAERNYKNSSSRFKEIAKRSGANPDNVLPEITTSGITGLTQEEERELQELERKRGPDSR